MTNERRLKYAALTLAPVLLLGGASVQYPGVMPAGIPQLSQETQRQSDRAVLTTEVRIGKVVSYNAGQISALVGGSVIPNAAYISSYRPSLGDYVVMTHQGSQWVVLGELAASPVNNYVQNGSFEQSGPGTSPALWGVAHTFGPATNVTIFARTDGTQLDGPNALEVDNNNIGFGTTDYVYSQPIPVVTGEIWSVSAYVSLLSGNIADSDGVLGVGFAWFADPSSVYPSTIPGPDALVQIFPGSLFDVWQRINGPTNGIQVPSGASFARVILFNSLNSGTGTVTAFWDRVVAQKVKNADGTYAP